MSKVGVCLFCKQYLSRKNQFLSNSDQDIFVIVNDKIFPLHLKYVKQIEYFAKNDFSQQKVQIIDQNFDEKIFQSVLGYYYGRPLQYQRGWVLVKILKIVDFLKCNKLKKLVLEDLKINFDDYGFFLLLNLSHVFKIKWLKQKCQQQLTLMNFQQLNYNRYDLYQIDRKAFQQLIKLHQLLKMNQNIIGIKDANLNRIVDQYCKNNKISDLTLQTIVDECLNDFELQKLRSSDRNQQIPQNRKKSVTEQIQVQKTIMKSSSHSQGGARSQIQNSTTQLDELKKINCSIRQKNDKLFEQINNIKNKINTEDNFDQKNGNNIQFDQIDAKFKKFQKCRQQQEVKFQSLKKQMQRLNSNNRNSLKSDHEQYEVQTNAQSIKSSGDKKSVNYLNSIAQSVKSNNNAKTSLFSQMPQLSKDLDS